MWASFGVTGRFWNDIVGMVAQLCGHTDKHWPALFKGRMLWPVNETEVQLLFFKSRTWLVYNSNGAKKGKKK